VLDELRQSHLALAHGDMPLLEDIASEIDELFQKKSSVSNQVRIHLKCTVSPHIAFFYLLFFFNHGGLLYAKN
jgi:hypothetical protein